MPVAPCIPTCTPIHAISVKSTQEMEYLWVLIDLFIYCFINIVGAKPQCEGAQILVSLACLDKKKMALFENFYAIFFLSNLNES
jgi:hypothetical protein